VPGDPDQVIYVWWDALGNYITAPGYGTGGEDYERWWTGADRRIHLVGKGVLRFHAVYWPAILLSAGEPLPTDILVHDYLTIGGSKISKSGAAAGNETADPVELVGRYGTDAVRWWLLREVPRVGDVDFTAARLTARANDDLANGLGNLVSRVVTLVHRYRRGKVPRQGEHPVTSAAGGQALASAAGGQALAAACQRAPERIAAALAAFDFRAATTAIWDVVDEANRYAERAEPWLLARAERDGDPAAGRLLDESLALLVGACSELGIQLAPFLPDLAGRIRAAVDDSAGQLPAAEPVFPRLEAAGVGAAV
jgi:methionyl-tRNA synthetase